MVRKQSVFTVILILALALSACGQTKPHGKVQVCFADKIDKGAYKSVDEKIIDEDGSAVAIFTDGLLKNLVLEYGKMDMDGIKFTPEKTIFELSQLEDDHLLEVKTCFWDVSPTLRLSFDGAEGREEYFLFQSGKDGSILLLRADELHVEAQPYGTVRVCFADEVDKTAYESVDEKIIDEEGDTIAIFTDGLLKNFVLEYGQMDMDGVKFTPEEKIFDLPELMDNHLLKVKTYFWDVNPTLRLSFDGAEGREEYFLFQSGKDGSILLLPAEEFLHPKS